MERKCGWRLKRDIHRVLGEQNNSWVTVLVKRGYKEMV